MHVNMNVPVYEGDEITFYFIFFFFLLLGSTTIPPAIVGTILANSVIVK